MSTEKPEKCVLHPCLDGIVLTTMQVSDLSKAHRIRYLVCNRPAESADHSLRVWMGCRARNSGSKSSSKTRPSISSGTGSPMRRRIVGAMSISRAPSTSIPFRKGLPWATRIPSRRCVPPHSAVVGGLRSMISTGGCPVSRADLDWWKRGWCPTNRGSDRGLHRGKGHERFRPCGRRVLRWLRPFADLSARRAFA